MIGLSRTGVTGAATVEKQEETDMRLKLLSPGEMSADQKQTYDESIAGKRGAPPPPMMAWLNSPEMARHATRLGGFLRFDTVFPAKLSEIAILVTARHWTSHYEWYAHKRLALTGGMDPKIIDAIRDRLDHAIVEWFMDPAAHRRQRLMARDREQPCGEPGAAFEARGLPPQLDEDFADDVFRGRGVADQAEREAVHGLLMADDQCLNCAMIAIGDTGQECFVRFDADGDAERARGGRDARAPVAHQDVRHDGGCERGGLRCTGHWGPPR